MARPSSGSIDTLAPLDIPALRVLWQKTYGTPAPAQAKRNLLTRCLAYALQERSLGGLAKPTLKALRAEEQGAAVSADTASSLRTGARLVRGWGGTTHEVTVIDRGFAYRGTTYRSLSEIARVITSAHWSGPRFFGIRPTSEKTRRGVHDRSA